jgi:hypothetical protein
VGASFGPGLATAAVDSFKEVIVKNDANSPIPVTVLNPPAAKPVLRSGEFWTDSGEFLPAGVVVTDIVLDAGFNECKVSVSLGDRSATMPHDPLTTLGGSGPKELHLQTGVRSTAAQPMFLEPHGTCPMRGFWTGYEG